MAAHRWFGIGIEIWPNPQLGLHSPEPDIWNDFRSAYGQRRIGARMADLSLSIALEHYERHVPFMQGEIKPTGIDLRVMIVGQEGRGGGRRHERMLHHQEFDVAELSLGSYVMARSRGVPLTAIPVFPRRLFSPSQMYVNTNAGIKSPKDLAGHRIGLRSFQTTLSVLAKGDLAHDYGVPLDSVIWVTTAEEPVSFDPPPGVVIERLAPDRKLGESLVSGELAGFFSPRPPAPYLEGSPAVGRLFDDPRSEELAYYHRNGFYPIMHIVAIRQDIADQNPWVAQSLLEAFGQSKDIWETYLDDPNWSSLAWGRHWLEQEREMFGTDIWPAGVESNRANLERFIEYEFNQGLISERMTVESLFFPTVVGT